MGRIERVDSELQKSLSILINNELKDYRIDANVCVTNVDTAKDLSYAKVYVSAILSKDFPSLVKALNNSAGFLRSALFNLLKIRTVPELKFFEDNSLDYGMKIERIIQEIAKEKDNKNV